MTDFQLSNYVPADYCVANGYPHPDLHPLEFYQTVCEVMAYQIQEEAMDLDEAKDLINIALFRAENPQPIYKKWTPIEAQIIDDLAA